MLTEHSELLGFLKKWASSVPGTISLKSIASLEQALLNGEKVPRLQSTILTLRELVLNQQTLINELRSAIHSFKQVKLAILTVNEVHSTSTNMDGD